VKNKETNNTIIENLKIFMPEKFYLKLTKETDEYKNLFVKKILFVFFTIMFSYVAFTIVSIIQR